jgi:hypothetical protein
VQYPVAGQQSQSSYQPRRQSFQNGDEGPFASQSRPPLATPARGGEDELFLTSPTESSAARPSFSPSTTAMSGYQHQYQSQSPTTPSHSTYNPQAFARSQSTSLPYHPVTRYTSPTATTFAPPQPTNYTPQAYNPAAYAQHTTTSAVPQRMATYSGLSNYSHSHSAPAVPQVQSTYGQQQPAPLYSPSLGGQTSPAQSFQQYQPPAQHGTPISGTMSSQATPYESTYATSYSGGQYFGSSFSNGTNSGQSSSYSTSTSQAPYPSYSQIPVGPNYSSNDPNAFINRLRSNSGTSPVPSPPTHSGSPGLQRHPTNAPLPSRPPMADVMEEPEWGGAGGRRGAEQERLTQDSLIEDIVADLGVPSNTQRPRPINGNMSDDEMDRLRRYDSRATTIHSSQDSSGVERTASTSSTLNRNNSQSTYDWDDADSDPEGAYGVYEMQQADLDDRRFSGSAAFPPIEEQRARAPSAPLPPPPEEQPGSDSDIVGMDLGLFSGGYAGNLTYGNEVGSPPATSQTHDDSSRPLPYPRSYDNETAYPPFSEADMDYVGTGGLQQPAMHRLSFDEGDERVSIHSRQSGSDSPFKEDYPDMFYHPGLSNRPLPALPPAASDSSSMLSVQTPGRGASLHGHSLSADARADTYSVHSAQSHQQVERSISLSSHSHTPAIQLPGRSRTDAADERRKMKQTAGQHWAGQQSPPSEVHDTGTPASMTYDMITLPSGRRRKFIPSKLTPADIRRCAEPWALSGIAAWIREMSDGEPDLKRKTIEEGLVKLFTSKVPTMNVADAETLSVIATDSMFSAGILLPEEEWVKFGHGSVSGVLWQLTGSGCYSPKLHEHEIPGRCYSYHCTRTLKKANLDDLMSEESIKKEDWQTFYKITKASLPADKPKKEIERQNNLHEIITSEEEYNNQLEVLRVLYRDQLRAWQPPIIAPNRLDKFIETVFGKVELVQRANKDNLLAQLKYRQGEQGPWIVGFADIFREWIRKAKDAYIAYSTAYSYAQYQVRKESVRNMLFRQFLEHVRNHKRSERLGWDTFLKAPITRLQRYTLLLGTVLKNTLQDSEEKANLERAIAEIREVTLECDKIVDEMQKKVSLIELQAMLVLRPGFQSVLNLDHLGRELILQGDLQRMGSKGVRWVDTHALLFDHYFILAKAVITKDGKGDKKFDVSKEVSRCTCWGDNFLVSNMP